MTSPKSSKNVIGYFTCAMGVLDYARNNGGDRDKEQEIKREYTRMLDETRRDYKAIPDEEKEKIHFAGELENELFHQLVEDRACLEASREAQKQMADTLRHDLDNKRKETDTLRHDLEKQKRRADTLQHALDCVHNSVSFRIGRAITYLPRKLRDLSTGDGKARSDK